MLFWIWLQQALGYGNRKIRALSIMYKNLEEFYNAGENEWYICGIFSALEMKKLKNTTLKSAESILENCYKNKIDIITFEDVRYPERLKNIVDPPAVLYIKGEMPSFDDKITVAIVGTRNCTIYGLQMAHDISYELAENDVVIVSGGAIGIDSAAHRGALKAGGTTAAILGCGINYPYLHQNAPLRKIITENGVLISEYPPDYELKKYHFLQRNRIISGLSLGTVVIEAGEKSGSLITANLANDQNRDVFVVPVDKRSPVSEGSYSLIEDGAKVITCAQNILGEYKNFPDIYKTEKIDNRKKSFLPQKSLYTMRMSANKKKIAPLPEIVSDEAKKIYKILSNEKMHIDKIREITGFETRQILTYLTELELLGSVRADFGKNYEIC